MTNQRNPTNVIHRGGGIVNAITKGTKTGQHRVHTSNSNGAPLCGGGNSARTAQWQEVILPPDCKRCEQILTKRKERHANRDQEPELAH